MKINEDDQKILDAVCKLVSEKELDVFLKGLKVNNIELNKLPTVHELGDIVLSDIYRKIKEVLCRTYPGERFPPEIDPSRLIFIIDYLKNNRDKLAPEPKKELAKEFKPFLG